MKGAFSDPIFAAKTVMRAEHYTPAHLHQPLPPHNDEDRDDEDVSERSKENQHQAWDTTIIISSHHPLTISNSPVRISLELLQVLVNRESRVILLQIV